jgi:3-methyladenine DNA glycosylase Tag
VTDDTWVAADGRRRCGWLPRNSSDFSYHDEVWGTPTRDERPLFEALSLGLFEIGMSWSVVFSKRRAPAHHQAPASLADVPTTNDEAERLSADLKRAGFTFVGPVSIYAFLQNVGVINDHIRGCFRALGADR